MNKNFTNLKNLFSVAILILFSASSLSLVSAQTILDDALADSGDTFQILAPAPGEKVSGSIRVRFNIADDDSSNVQYFSSIFDAGSCVNTNYGQISPTSTVSGNNFLWNTKATSATSNLADGVYCLKICVAFLNGTSPYTACNGRLVHILNNNSKPVITSNPPKLVFTEGESFNYQVVATDPNNDPLEYRFETTAPFLNINKNTGLITGQPMTVPADATISGLKYTITVVVDDNKSGAVKQTFEITVLKKVVTPPPAPVPNPVPTPTPTPVPTPTPTPVPPTTEPKLDFRFLEPKKDFVLKGDDLLIKWKLSGVEVKSLSLEYSTDGTEWEVIQNNIDKSKDSFTWDTEGREDSEYYIRMKIELSNGQIIYKQSDKFSIDKDTDEDIESEPLIIDQKPETNSEITEKRPEISATFLPSNERETNLDSVEISLDGKDIKEKCEITITGFKCILDSDLEFGKHLVKVSFKDTSDKKAEVEWSFTIKDPTSAAVDTPSKTGDTDPNSVIILGREVPKSAAILIGIICCLGTLLLVIPWILYLLWSRRSTRTVTLESAGKRDGGDLDTTVNVNTYDPYADLDTNFLSSYTVPTQAPNLGNPITETTSDTYYPSTTTETTTTNFVPDYSTPTYTPPVETNTTTNFITPTYTAPSYTEPTETTTTSDTYVTPDYTVPDYNTGTSSTTTDTTSTSETPTYTPPTDQSTTATDTTNNFVAPTYNIPGYTPFENTTTTSTTESVPTYEPPAQSTATSFDNTDYSTSTYTEPTLETNPTVSNDTTSTPGPNYETNTTYNFANSSFDPDQAGAAPQTPAAAPVEPLQPIDYNEKYSLPDYLTPYTSADNSTTATTPGTTTSTSTTTYTEPTATS